MKRCEVELVAASRQKTILEAQLKTLQSEVHAARENESVRKADIEELKVAVTSLEEGRMAFHKSSPHDMNLETHTEERKKESHAAEDPSTAAQFRIKALEDEKIDLQKQLSEAHGTISTLRAEKEKALSEVTILEAKLTRLSSGAVAGGELGTETVPKEAFEEREAQFQNQIRALEESYVKEIKLLEARLVEAHSIRDAEAQSAEPGYMHDSVMGTLKKVLPPTMRPRDPKFPGGVKGLAPGTEQSNLALTMGNSIGPYNSTMGLIAHITPTDAAANLDLSQHSSTEYTED